LKPVAVWARRFDNPILLTGGRELPTLRDAGDYITSLPKAEQDLEEWQAAVEALLMAAEGRGPVMHSRIGVLHALNRNIERVFTDRKDLHWGKRKLRRDQRQPSGSMSTPARKLATSTTSRYSRRQSLPMSGSRRMTRRAEPVPVV
jgi:hypothetical protein